MSEIRTFQAKSARPAPATRTGPIGWLRENLFSSPLNTILTLGGLWLAYTVTAFIVEWAFLNAVWVADTRRECLDRVGTSGACWAGVIAWWQNLIYGLYPKDQIWRINAGFFVLVLWIAPLWMRGVRSKVAIGLSAVLIYPFLASYFFLGGERGWLWAVLIALSLACFVWVWATTLTERTTGATLGQFLLALLGARELPDERQRQVLRLLAALGFLAALAVVSVWDLPAVSTRQWGGLFLTLVISGIGIAFSLPAGVVLALGRRSKLPVISLLCTVFIELFRSVPLITVLFMFTTMLPLFLP
ncbi:MAG: ABC transporter permease subunit, partial [Guyparkeria sp.]